MMSKWKVFVWLVERACDACGGSGCQRILLVILYIVADCIPICDEFYRRFVNFVFSALNCGCNLVNFVVRHSLVFHPMNSPIGRNVVSCSLRYGITLGSLVES